MDDAAFTRGAAGISALAGPAYGGTKTAEVDDSELVRRVRRGDDRAFEQLYHRYHRRIVAYIHGMVHDHARAEDISQDVFVSALRRMRDTDRPIAFKPWIYEIAKNACIDQFRRSRRAEEVSYDADEGMGAADYGRLVSSEAVPEARLESKQNLDHLRGAFGGLSETHHEILVMRELEGLSYREIGERLGMSRPSVESTLFRARRRLTEEYEELVSGARCQRIHSIIADAAGAAPGARDQRRLARHVSHCQPCRRQARLAGLDIPVTSDRPVRQRIAAMLPLPLFLRKRWSADSVDASGVSTSHLTGFAQWSSQFGSSVDPSWLKAAATAASVAVAGAGAGLAGSTSTGSTPIGSFNQLVPSLSGDDGGKRLIAGSGPSVSAALRTGDFLATTIAAPAPAPSSEQTSTTAGSASGTTTTATTESAATPDPLRDAGNGIEQIAAAVVAPQGGSSAPSTGTGSGTAGGSSPSASSLGGGNADGVSRQDPDLSSVIPPADGAPSIPPVNASAPDVAGTVEQAGGAVKDAGDAIADGLGGG